MKTQIVFPKGREAALLSLDDQRLIHTYRTTGNQDCLEELLKRYVPFIQRICRRYFPGSECEEMCMRVLEKLIRLLGEIEIHQFPQWLRNLCRNECLMELRQRRRAREAYRRFAREVRDSAGDSARYYPAWVSPGPSLCDRLRTAMNTLSAPQRECLLVYYFHHLSYREISECTGYSLKEVKSHLQNGRRNLGRILRKERG